MCSGKIQTCLDLWKALEHKSQCWHNCTLLKERGLVFCTPVSVSCCYRLPVVGKGHKRCKLLGISEGNSWVGALCESLLVNTYSSWGLGTPVHPTESTISAKVLGSELGGFSNLILFSPTPLLLASFCSPPASVAGVPPYQLFIHRVKNIGA